jgi:hypothetical protein
MREYFENVHRAPAAELTQKVTMAHVKLTSKGRRKVLELSARARSIQCPRCFALAGHACFGEGVVAGVHFERLRLSRILDEPDPKPRGNA